MSDTEQETRCFGCFAEKAGVNPCPQCGFDETAPRAANALPLGTVLADQYSVGRVLGKPGGFGITYLGFDRHLQTTVAIKEYLPRDLATRGGDGSTVLPHTLDEQSLFDYGLKQFLAEAQTLAQLDHPNIVRVRQFFASNRSAYLVMDYYRGVSLAEHLDSQPATDGRRRLPEAAALALMQPILDGLRAVHDKGFLHRDIKPQNIYLAQTDSGGVRPILLDFGTARLAMGERSRSMSVVISPGFAPFEQYHRSGRQGPFTDIYGAAAVLYWMLTGLTPPEATERVHADDLAPAASFGVSAAVSTALARALAMDPAARPQTVVALQAQLRGATHADTAGAGTVHAADVGAEGMPPPEHFAQLAAKASQASPEPPRSSSTQRDAAAPAGPRRGADAARRIAAAAVVAALLAGGGFAVWQGYQESRANTDAAAFAAAQREDTAAAYRAYLERCAAGGCGHHAAARARLAALEAQADRDQQDAAAYATARAADNAATYRAYLEGCEAYGCGHRDAAQARIAALADAARERRDRTAFGAARAVGTAAAYRAYLRGCAADGCGHRADAEQQLDKRLREDRDDADYARARADDSVPAYRRYLEACAANGCAHRVDAERRLERLIAAAATSRCRGGYLSAAQLRALLSGRTAYGRRIDVAEPYGWKEYQADNGTAYFQRDGKHYIRGRWKTAGDLVCWCYGTCREYQCKRVYANSDCSALYYEDPDTGARKSRVDSLRQGDHTN
ncbi:serine/threonine-protein kinase [uncultured Thiohalocapsa sp.]|uniref:serine/threonine-protein kinase n=1 Tax=uncultured Thiohalocapsa sp. TaxID=768990 RepID=UPI0025F00F59|nr:serine/threonine-protein kinase [uncultured Thiohalocapsa sp.]